MPFLSRLSSFIGRLFEIVVVVIVVSPFVLITDVDVEVVGVEFVGASELEDPSWGSFFWMKVVSFVVEALLEGIPFRPLACINWVGWNIKKHLLNKKKLS